MSKAYQNLLKSLPASNTGSSAVNSSVGSQTEKYKQLLQETTAERLGKFQDDEAVSEDEVEEQEDDGLEGDLMEGDLMEGDEGDMMGLEGDDMLEYEGEEGDMMGMEGDDDMTLTAEDEEALKLFDEDDGTFEDDSYNKTMLDIIEDSELSSDAEEVSTTVSNGKRKKVEVAKSTFSGVPYDRHFNHNVTAIEHNKLQKMSIFLPVSSKDAGLREKSQAKVQRLMKTENSVSFAAVKTDTFNRDSVVLDDEDTSVYALLSDVQRTSTQFMISSDRAALNEETRPDFQSTSFSALGVRPRLASYWTEKCKFSSEVYAAMKEFNLSLKEESQAMVEKTKNELARKIGLKSKRSDSFMHELQRYLAPVVFQYKDLFFANPNPCVPLVEYNVIQDLFLSHALNHVFTAKDLQVSHNESLARKTAKQRERDVLAKAEHLNEAEKRAQLQEREKALLGGGGALSSQDQASLTVIQRQLKQTGQKSKQHQRVKNRKLDDARLQEEIASVHATTLLNTTFDATEKYRDQGFTRPKVLILTPNKSCAYQLIMRLLELLPEKNRRKILNVSRLHEQFGDVDEENVPKQSRVLDHRLSFLGDDDDCFKMGLSFSNTEVKLFSKFYASDIIIGSPLGIKLLAGNEGDDNNDRKTDFLSSIEVCILDQAERFTMQNLDHVHDVFHGMNSLPKQNVGIDFTRVRPWYLDGQARFYRQTLVFSSYGTTALHTLFQRYCENRAGRFRIRPAEYSSVVHRVRPRVKHVFVRLDDVKDSVDAAEQRFQVFEREMWPKIKDSYREGQVLFFVPSYYDYVRIRNFLKARFARFGILSEYTDPRMIGVVRSNFYKGLYQFVLVSERFHHFNRTPIKAVKHVVWYGLPDHPAYYYEMLNNIDGSGKSAEILKQSTSFVMYTKQDAMNLEKIVGSEMSADMLTARQHIHMITPK